MLDRRRVLKGGLVLLATSSLASIYQPVQAKTFTGGAEPWRAVPPAPLRAVDGRKLVYLSPDEAQLIGSIFDVLIPEEDGTMGAVDAGCVTFLDHQLAGPFGQGKDDYRSGPVVQGTPQQGPQDIDTPAQIYRRGLKELQDVAQSRFGKPFEELGEDQKISFLQNVESGTTAFKTVKGTEFFALMLQNVREGFLADPIYGGNKDMVGWKMIGFPGAMYDFRDWVVSQRGKKIDVQPVSLLGNI